MGKPTWKAGSYRGSSASLRGSRPGKSVHVEDVEERREGGSGLDGDGDVVADAFLLFPFSPGLENPTRSSSPSPLQGVKGPSYPVRWR